MDIYKFKELHDELNKFINDNWPAIRKAYGAYEYIDAWIFNKNNQIMIQHSSNYGED